MLGMLSNNPLDELDKEVLQVPPADSGFAVSHWRRCASGRCRHVSKVRARCQQLQNERAQTLGRRVCLHLTDTSHTRGVAAQLELAAPHLPQRIGVGLKQRQMHSLHITFLFHIQSCPNTACMHYQQQAESEGMTLQNRAA